MICKTCQKLALFHETHRCANCPRFCDSREQKLCDYCSTLKEICSVCGKKIQNVTVNDVASQVEQTHPFFPTTGCKSCGR